MKVSKEIKIYGNNKYHILTQEDTKEGFTYVYQQIENGEYDRIKSNTYQDTFGEETINSEGSSYVNESGEKKYAYIGYYDPNKTYSPSALSKTESQYGTISNFVQNDSRLKQRLFGSPNTASTNPNQPGTPGTSTPTQPTSNQNTGESDAYLKYPIRMKDDQDRIKFQALEYRAGGASGNRLTEGGNPFELKGVTYRATGPAVLLPIQSAITDQNSVGWETDTLNPIEVEAAKLSRELMTTAKEDLFGVASRNLSDAYRAAKGATNGGEAIRTWMVGQAISVNNLLSRLQGQVLNPNLELLFQGPQLRPFNFTFKLSPRSKNEAIVVKKIIRYFKQNMAAIKDNNIFLRAPNVFKIEYQYKKDTIHPGLNLIKECALTNCSVDYTPNGTYMTYPEGTMVSYTLTLQFQELTPIYSNDYKEGDGASHPIGF